MVLSALCKELYDVANPVLENVTGFARLDVNVYGPVAKYGIGICLYIGETNFPFHQTLYESECHQHQILRGLDISNRPMAFYASSCMTGIRRCPVSSARSTQKFGGEDEEEDNIKR